MSDKDILYQILIFALIDIRTAAYEKKSHKAIFIVADLIHNLPLQLCNTENGQSDFKSILSKLKERAKIKKCDIWLDEIINDLILKG